MIDSIRAQGGVPRRVYAQLKAVQAADDVQLGREEDDAAKPANTAEEAPQRLTENLTQAATAMALAYLTMGSLDDEGMQEANPNLHMRRVAEEMWSILEMIG